MSNQWVLVDSFLGPVDKCQLLLRLARIKILGSLASSWIWLVGRGISYIAKLCLEAPLVLRLVWTRGLGSLVLSRLDWLGRAPTSSIKGRLSNGINQALIILSCPNHIVLLDNIKTKLGLILIETLLQRINGGYIIGLSDQHVQLPVDNLGWKFSNQGSNSRSGWWACN